MSQEKESFINRLVNLVQQNQFILIGYTQQTGIGSVISVRTDKGYIQAKSINIVAPGKVLLVKVDGKWEAYAETTNQLVSKDVLLDRRSRNLQQNTYLKYPLKAVVLQHNFQEKAVYIALDRRKPFKIAESTNLDYLSFDYVGFAVTGIKTKDWVFSIFNYSPYDSELAKITFFYPDSTLDLSYIVPKSLVFRYMGNNVWVNNPYLSSTGSKDFVSSDDVLENIQTDTEYKKLTKKVQTFTFTKQSDWEPYLVPTDVGSFSLEETSLRHNENNSHFTSGEPKDFEYFVPYPYVVDGFELDEFDRSLTADFEYTDKQFVATPEGLGSSDINVASEQEEEGHKRYYETFSGSEVYIQIPVPGSSDRRRKTTDITYVFENKETIQTLLNQKSTGDIFIYADYKRPTEIISSSTRDYLAEGIANTSNALDGEYVFVDSSIPNQFQATSGQFTEVSNSNISNVIAITSSQVTPEVLLVGQGCCIFSEYSQQKNKTTVYSSSYNLDRNYNYQGLGTYSQGFSQNRIDTTAYTIPTTNTYIYLESSDSVIKLQNTPNLFGRQTLGYPQDMPDIGETGSINFVGYQTLLAAPSAFITKAEYVFIENYTHNRNYVGISNSQDRYPIEDTPVISSAVSLSNILTTTGNPLWEKVIGRKVCLSTYKDGKAYKYKGVVTDYSFDVTPNNNPEHPPNSFTSIVGEYPVNRLVTNLTIDITESGVVPHDVFSVPGSEGIVTLYCDEGNFSIRNFMANYTNLVAVPPPQDTDSPYVVARIYHAEDVYFLDFTKKQLWIEVFDINSEGLISFKEVKKSAIYPTENQFSLKLALLYSP